MRCTLLAFGLISLAVGACTVEIDTSGLAESGPDFSGWDLPGRMHALEGVWSADSRVFEIRGDEVRVNDNERAGVRDWKEIAERRWSHVLLRTPCSLAWGTESAYDEEWDGVLYVLRDGRLHASSQATGARQGDRAVACESWGKEFLFDGKGCRSWTRSFGHWFADEALCGFLHDGDDELFYAIDASGANLLHADRDVLWAGELGRPFERRAAFDGTVPLPPGGRAPRSRPAPDTIEGLEANHEPNDTGREVEITAVFVDEAMIAPAVLYGQSKGTQEMIVLGQGGGGISVAYCVPDAHVTGFHPGDRVIAHGKLVDQMELGLTSCTLRHAP